LLDDLKEKYQDFNSKKLYTGRLPFEEFIDFVKKNSFIKVGIEGRALSPHIDYTRLEAENYQDLTSEEYYKLIKNKKGTEVRITVWCGKDQHKPWDALMSNLLQKKWCGSCADEGKIKFSLERLKELAKQRGLEENGVEGKILDSKTGDKVLTKETYDKLTRKIRPSKAKFW